MPLDEIPRARTKIVSAAVPTTVALTLCAFLFVMAAPLALRLVPPNPLYGFRGRATLSDRELWYSANAFAGRALLMSAVVSAVLVWLHPAWFALGEFTNLAAVVLPSIIALVASFVYLRNHS
jgi:uncharacterized membrane protein